MCLFSIVAFVLLSPLAAWLFARFVASSGHEAVGNFDIAFFLLSPTRLALALGATSLLVAISFLRIGGQLLIGYGAAEHRRVRFFQALFTVLRQGARVVALSLVVLALLTLILFPFLAVAGLAARHLLSDHDINHYLESRPPEFWMAVGWGACWAVVHGALAVGGARVIFSLPNLLLMRLRVPGALRQSLQQTRGRWLMIAKWLLIWAVFWLLVFSVVNWLSTRLGAETCGTGDRSNPFAGSGAGRCDGGFADRELPVGFSE